MLTSLVASTFAHDSFYASIFLFSLPVNFQVPRKVQSTPKYKRMEIPQIIGMYQSIYNLASWWILFPSVSLLELRDK